MPELPAWKLLIIRELIDLLHLVNSDMELTRDDFVDILGNRLEALIYQLPQEEGDAKYQAVAAVAVLALHCQCPDRASINKALYEGFMRAGSLSTQQIEIALADAKAFVDNPDTYN